MQNQNRQILHAYIVLSAAFALVALLANCSSEMITITIGMFVIGGLMKHWSYGCPPYTIIYRIIFFGSASYIFGLWAGMIFVLGYFFVGWSRFQEIIVIAGHPLN